MNSEGVYLVGHSSQIYLTMEDSFPDHLKRLAFYGTETSETAGISHKASVSSEESGMLKRQLSPLSGERSVMNN